MALCKTPAALGKSSKADGQIRTSTTSSQNTNPTSSSTATRFFWAGSPTRASRPPGPLWKKRRGVRRKDEPPSQVRSLHDLDRAAGVERDPAQGRSSEGSSEAEATAWAGHPYLRQRRAREHADFPKPHSQN